MRTIPLILFLIFAHHFPRNAYSQIIIKGQILEAETSDPVPYATIFESNSKESTFSDESGSFQLVLPNPSAALLITSLGYENLKLELAISSDTTLTVYMHSSTDVMEAIEIEAEKEAVISRNQTAVVNLKPEEINYLPSIGGETDVISIAQLMPGMTKGMEASSDLFVRGGDADQNLVLLDQAPLYNPSHMLSFLSVFNPDVIDEFNLYKGAFPAQHGGRLSSVLDIKTINPAKDDYHIKGGVGLISSRLLIKERFFENRFSIMLAGRRTYIDQVLKTVDRDLPYYFYDLNGKIQWRLSENNQFEFSTFTGQDILGLGQSHSPRSHFKSSFRMTNSAQTIRWNHVIHDQHFMEMSLSRSLYKYRSLVEITDSRINIESSLQDFKLQNNFEYHTDQGPVIDYGLAITQHSFHPNQIYSIGRAASIIPTHQSSKKLSYEVAAYVQSSAEFFTNTQMQAGARLSSSIVGGKVYYDVEPRINIEHPVKDDMTLSANYTRMTQYIHRVSSSEISLPTDVWYPVSNAIRPQTSDQFGLGLMHKLQRINSKLSMELYYKNLNHLIDYQEGTDLTLNNDYEEVLVQGWGNSYGIELLLKKEKGKFSGWAAYTLSWANRRFEMINNGKTFPARYDRRHNISLVGNYKIHKRWAVSAIWEFISGARFTAMTGRYIIPNPSNSGLYFNPIYTSKNEVKLPDSHRLDLSIILFSREKAKFDSEWHFSVYNVYNRATPYGLKVVPQDDGTYRYEQPGLFGLIPSVSYQFKI